MNKEKGIDGLNSVDQKEWQKQEGLSDFNTL